MLKRHAKFLIKYISNPGKFRAIRLWVWSSKVSFTTALLIKSEFFENIFDLTLSFLQASFKRWVNNKQMFYESPLLRIFYYIWWYTIISILIKRFEVMLTATLGKNLGPSMPEQSDDSCLQEKQDTLVTCSFLYPVKLMFWISNFVST